MMNIALPKPCSRLAITFEQPTACYSEHECRASMHSVAGASSLRLAQLQHDAATEPSAEQSIGRQAGRATSAPYAWCIWVT